MHVSRTWRGKWRLPRDVSAVSCRRQRGQCTAPHRRGRSVPLPVPDRVSASAGRSVPLPCRSQTDCLRPLAAPSHCWSQTDCLRPLAAPSHCRSQTDCLRPLAARRHRAKVTADSAGNWRPRGPAVSEVTRHGYWCIPALLPQLCCNTILLYGEEKER